MRLSIVLRLAPLALVMALFSLPAVAQDQSTGDVAAAARKAREQAAAAPKPKKVLTNDDIPAAKTDAPATTGTDAAKPADGTTGTAQTGAAKSEDNDPKSEAYWRKKFAAQHEKISTAEKELDILQRELDKGQVQYYSDPQTALQQQHDRSDINDKTAKIDAKKKEIDDLKQQLSDMEDEMRKAGGDPGWAR
jgi:hypothetical protein